MRFRLAGRFSRRVRGLRARGGISTCVCVVSRVGCRSCWLCVGTSLSTLHLSPVRITTIMLGNGAGPPGMPFGSNRSRPLRNLTSARLRMYCWNHRVSVRAGSSMTTRVSLRLASILHLRTHSGIALPYGGLQNTVFPPPLMIECAVFSGKVFWAFVVRVAACRVQREVKLRVELVKQFLWGLPIHAV